jgi:hypothetical protein
MSFKEAFRRYPLFQFVFYFLMWFLIDWAISERGAWKDSLGVALVYSAFMTLLNNIIYQPLIPLYFKKEKYDEMCRYVEHLGYQLSKDKEGVRYYRKGSFPGNYRNRMRLKLTAFYSSIEIPVKMQEQIEAKIEEMDGRLY